MMTSNEYARKVAELIDARPRHIDLDKLLHEIYVLAKIAESRRAQKEGHGMTNEQMREKLRGKISLEPVKRNGRQKTSKTVEYAQKKTGRWSTPEQVMERMWKLIRTKLADKPCRSAEPLSGS
jgi:hypothetical protein